MKDYCNRDDVTNSVSVGTKGSMQLVDNFKKKFLKEARFIAQLSDVPHIVRIYDVFEENQTAYYVMEYINGGSLKELVRKNGPLNEQQAIGYITQIGQALQSLHQHNILHLDVKPENVLLNSRGEAVLIDFGVSKRYDQTGSQTSTTPIGLSKGYAPIEQYKDGGMELFTPATDIYSLGATLYYLLAGHTPPEADEVMENGLPERPASVSPAVWNAIGQAMQPIKKNRPQSVDAFLSLLGNTSIVPPPVVNEDDPKTQLSSKTTSVNTVKTDDSLSQTTKLQLQQKKAHKHKWLWPVVTLCSVAAIALVLVFFVFPQKSPEDKLVGLMEDAVSIMKDTHIKSQDDVKALAEKMKPLKENVENAIKEMIEAYKDKDPKELEQMSKNIEEKMKKISEEAEKEGERLQKEAAEAGVDLSELESLDLF